MKASSTQPAAGVHAPGAAAAEKPAAPLSEAAASVVSATERLETLYTEATTLADSLGDASSELNEFIHEQAHTRPYAALGVAAGAGFILAGGLTPKVGGLLLTLGGKMLANRLLREVLDSAQA
jgi:ElaB/YqjD/DUF883 family membrane-anchored ribosome-binding protein